jgi:hypothetical protein
MRDFTRPAMPGRALFDALPGGEDPAARVEAGLRLAELLVRGARTSEDRAVVDRVVTLADDQGLDLLAELWSQAPAETLAGALWRLYLLRAWVRRHPSAAAREFDAGRAFAPVHEVVAGVVDPPGPDEVIALVDVVLRGLVSGDLAVTLERAAAFARVVATGRAALAEAGSPDAAGTRTRAAARLQDTAADLERAARFERTNGM